MSRVLQRADINALIARFTGAKSRHPNVEVAPVLQPVLIVGDARDEAVPQAARLAYGGPAGIVAPGAGNVTSFQLANPTGSSVDVWLDFIALYATVNSDFLINAVTAFSADLAVLDSAAFRTGETVIFTPGNPFPIPAAHVSHSNLLAPAGTGIPFRGGVANTTLIPFDAQLPPGSIVTVTCQGVGTSSSVAFFWSEVPRR